MENDLPNQDPYAIVNSSVQYTFTPALSKRARFKNMLNKEYRTPTSCGVPNRGFTFTLGLVSKF